MGSVNFRFEPLSSEHDRAAFRCGVLPLDEYLQKQAGQDARRYISACFVMLEEGRPKGIVGYYTLSAYAVDVSEFPDEAVRKIPKYPKLPAMLIGRLARDTRFPGIGGLLLWDALRRAAAHVSSVAAVAVVVDAKDQKAEDFYKRHGFVEFKNLSRKLFIPMGTIHDILKQRDF